MRHDEQHIRDLIEVYRRAYKIELTRDEALDLLERQARLFHSLRDGDR